MTKSSKHFKFLDRILKLLSKNTHRSFDFQEISDELDLREIKSDFFGNPVLFIRPVDYNHNFNLIAALHYLSSEGYIYEMVDGFRITYKGILKLKTDPYKDEMNKKEWGTKRERMLLIITAISLGVVFIKEFPKLFSY